MSILYFLFALLVWIFFYKLINSNTKQHHVPWYGFAIFLFVITTIYVFIAIGSLVTSSIQVSEAEKKKQCKK